VLDPKFIRQFPDLVREGARKKRIALDLDGLLAVDAEARAAQTEVDGLRARQNALSKEVGKAPADQRAALIAEVNSFKAQLAAGEARLKELQADLEARLLRVPNVPAVEVPEGKDDSENVEVRKVGTPRAFDFEARDHVALAEAQGWLEIERAARMSGSRNYVLKGELSMLETAVMRYALDLMIDRGFTPLTVPTLVRREIMVGTMTAPVTPRSSISAQVASGEKCGCTIYRAPA